MVPGEAAGGLRVYLADDHPLFLAGISRVIEEDPELELVGTAQEGVSALAEILLLKPEVAVIDIGMPGTNGLQVLAALKEVESKTRVIILTGTERRNMLLAAVQEGAVGYLLKTIHWNDLLVAIKKAGRGESIIASANSDTTPAEGLTPREREVLNCLARNLTVKQIASELNIEITTVRFHLSRIYKRLEVQSMAQAVREAMRLGIIQ